MNGSKVAVESLPLNIRNTPETPAIALNGVWFAPAGEAPQDACLFHIGQSLDIANRIAQHVYDGETVTADKLITDFMVAAENAIKSRAREGVSE